MTTTTTVDADLRTRFPTALDLALTNTRTVHAVTEPHGDRGNRATATLGKPFRAGLALADIPGDGQRGWIRVTRLAGKLPATMTAEADGTTTFDNDLADETPRRRLLYRPDGTPCRKGRRRLATDGEGPMPKFALRGWDHSLWSRTYTPDVGIDGQVTFTGRKFEAAYHRELAALAPAKRRTGRERGRRES